MLTLSLQTEVAFLLQEGAGMSALAREFRTSRQTILRARDALAAS